MNRITRVFAKGRSTRRPRTDRHRILAIEPLEQRRLLTTLAFQDKLVAQEIPQGDDRFGHAVAVDGDTMVVGALQHDVPGLRDAGTAYVFVRDDQGTPGDESDDRWAFEAALIASDADAGVKFGGAVSISGETVVVGAYRTDGGGSAYVFTRTDGVWSEQDKLTASDAAAGDSFGYSVSISGETVVVGADRENHAGDKSGSAYVFTRTAGVWSQQDKLTAADAATGDHFGFSVSISGETVVVGAYQDDDAGISSGSAYVFTRTAGVWSEQDKLTADDAAAADYFGWSVSISGDSVVVGAYSDDDLGIESGAAYVFTRAWNVWSEQQKLVASDATAGDIFGLAVSISGDTVVVSAPSADDSGGDSGSAYVFARARGTWREQDKLTASDAAAGDEFGYSVSIDGETVVVGAWLDDDASVDSGSAYAFDRSGGSWWELPKLHLPRQDDPMAGDSTGRSVAVDGDYMVVGAYLRTVGGLTNAGAAYVFVRDDNRTPGNQWDDRWTFGAALTANDAAADDRFGGSVSISGDTIVVGANGDDGGIFPGSGAAYVFTRAGSLWTQQQKLIGAATDDAAWRDVFGSSVSISGDTVVVGTFNDIRRGSAYVFTRTAGVWSEQEKLIAEDADGTDGFGLSVSIDGYSVVVGAGYASGFSAYVFTRADNVWSQQQKLVTNDSPSPSRFGRSVSISGETVVVGADNDDVVGAGAGSAYVFTRTAGVWSEQDKLTAGDAAEDDRFGASVSISGETLVVGAGWVDSILSIDSGAAYVFTRAGSVWSQHRKLVAGDGFESAFFGAAVSISGETVVVGAYGDGSDSGSAYVYGPAYTGVFGYAEPSGGGANNLTLRRNGPYLEVYDEVASQVVAAERVVMAQAVEITGADDVDDLLTIDFPYGGHFAPVDGIRFDGGSGGNDSLRIAGTGTTAGSYRPSGTTTGSGDVPLDGPAGTTTVQFDGLETFEVSAMSQFVLQTPNVRDNITLAPSTGSGNTQASTISGASGGVAFRPLTFFDVPDFEFDLASPDQTVFDADAVAFSGTKMARGLRRLTISSGDGADTFDVGSALIKLDDGFRIRAADGRLTLNGGRIKADTLEFANGRIELAGGTINADTLDVAGGELSGYGTVNAAISGLARIEAEGGALDLGDGSFGAVDFDGVLDVADQVVTLNTAGLANLGGVTSIDDGTLVAPGGVVLGIGDNLVGHGTVAGRVAAATGSTILATGDLQLGDAASLAGFFSDGELYVGNHTVTIEDLDVGMLGSLTEIGGADGAGTLTARNGLLLEAGKTAFGYGIVNGDFINQGHVVGGGPQPDDELEFTGDVSGTGSFDGNINFSGTYLPGDSPAAVDFWGNVTFGPTSTLEIELDGPEAGRQYDQLVVDGSVNLALNSRLNVSLNYTPAPADGFIIVDNRSAEAVAGTFAGLPEGAHFVVDGQPLQITYQGGDGNDVVINPSIIGPWIIGRYVFYNNSSFDNHEPLPNSDDDAAIATDKSALLPDQTATFANYTSYSRGINGMIVDIADPLRTPSEADFEFKVGGDDTPGDWDDAPLPSSVTVRPGQGTDGSDRVTIIWADNVIENQWLQVTVLAENTGLAENNVFYYGNAIGDSGNSAGDAKVNAFDMLGARDNQRNFLDPAPIDFAFDYDRNARVDAADMLIAREDPTHFLNALRLIGVPGAKSAAAEAQGAEVLADVPAWLGQWEHTTTARRPAGPRKPAPQAVDRLLLGWGR